MKNKKFDQQQIKKEIRKITQELNYIEDEFEGWLGMKDVDRSLNKLEK